MTTVQAAEATGFIADLARVVTGVRFVKSASKNIFKKGVLASSLLLSLSLGSMVQAGVVLDNTNGGTDTISTSFGSLTTTNKNFKVFTVGASDVQITQQTMGLWADTEQAGRNITFELYGVDANNDPTGTALASDTQAVTITGGGSSNRDFYTFDTGGTLAAFTLEAGETYGMLFSSDATSSSFSWSNMTNEAIYTVSEGFTFIANRRTAFGNPYSANEFYNAWSMTVTDSGGGSVPEPTSLSMIGLGAIGVGIRSRKRLKASVKKVLRQD